MQNITLTGQYARVLSIAGSDSGGGAGIQADLKTFSALGCYGMTAITALTAQNTTGVQAIHGVPAVFLKAQLQSVLDDIGVDAVKIGMLHSPDVVEVVAWAIDHYGLKQVVLDPVMVATSGDRLIAQETVAVLVSELFPRVQLVTPNLDEASLLLQKNLSQIDELQPAGLELLAMGAKAVLLKGGHLQGDVLCDVLHQLGTDARVFQSTRIHSRNVHGTGCSLSSAIAAYLALGHDMHTAVEQARAFIRQAIASGAAVKTGEGHGPLNHGFAPLVMHVKPLP
ncbi:MAG: bifunctional hydroxymethylpyrimidine kinase/phosphomethylpyrimidine kinase [Burkholderiales bacterium]|nr:bifunctional hydroxymethylpyrimidine kinase/phosphomethylpyrimidine kinase [Burkholderiales bacterium]